MNKAFVVLGSVVLFVGMWFFASIHYPNRAIGLENRAKATRKRIEGTFDNMWKIIEGKAGVTSQYKDDFRAALAVTVEGRKGGEMAKFIQEHAVNLDPGMYRDVSNAIEGQRTIFLNSETELLAIIQEHDNLLQQAPSSWFVGGRTPLVYNMVTSKRTKEAIESGNDESDPDPFRARQKAEAAAK